MFRLKNRNRKIKVYFICQYVQGCNKIYDVVSAMKADNVFDVRVLAVPDDINKFPKNNEYDFWYSKFGNITINAVDGNKWFDLKSKKPDYVFVQRPYDNYVPMEYRVDTIKNYSKLCYIPYGYELINLRNVAMPDFFVKNISLFFCSQDEEYDYCKSIIDNTNDGVNRKCFNLGYPSLYNVACLVKNKKSAFDNIDKRTNFNVMWSPRWTTSDNLSKTNFFEYKDLILDYMRKHKDINFVFRPHPLIFKNFIENNIMTKKQVKDYLNNFKNSNMYYDFDSDYYNTFADSDVLVADFSSILVEYFIFNKPVIYCSKTSNMTTFMKKLLKCFYVVKDWNELKETLENIKNGNDYLKPKRESLLKSFLSKYDEDVSLKILDEIKKDFYNIK